ncbi:MAG: hypothetical protein EPN17_10030 [Methylobacter sp.]|nr:MAG: hypothetical protein EPN17_10030 [Methylobacter sp.]
MSNSNKTSSADLNSIKTGWVLTILVVIGLVIVGFYFFNFNSHILKNEGLWKVFQNLSADTGNWGTFGDYVGGILNPVIAAFAFYLIAKTYELQKRELEATRSLLEVSTDAQKNQIKLAALTALLNSNLMKIDMLNSERINLHETVEKNQLRRVTADEEEKTAILDQNSNHLTHLEITVKNIKEYNCDVARLEEQINDLLKKP